MTISVFCESAVMSEVELASSVTVSQYVEFTVYSESVSAAMMSESLDAQPDRATVMGSRDASRPVPVNHAWVIECKDAIPLHEQVNRLLRRVRDLAPALRGLLEATDATVALGFVREFGGAEGVPAEGQLSWWLDAADVALLAELGASIDSDEYAL
jgi:hypothetical protein